jgi:hypothetical protein
MKTDRTVTRVVLGATIAGAAMLGLVGVSAAKTTTVKLKLTATAKAPHAKGQTQLVVRRGGKGRFMVLAKRLAPNGTFDVIVGGVKVGTLTTNHGGAGKAKFDTTPNSKETLLGFDPRGDQVVLRDDAGDDDLVGDEPNDDSASGACCLGSHDLVSGDHHGGGEAECEEMSTADCTKHGGTPNAAASCLPNPCATTPPPNEQLICCRGSAQGAFVEEDPEVECNDVHAPAECADEGGTLVSAASCDPNPCAPTPPSSPAVPCCVSHEGETECRMLTSDSCTAHNGTAANASSCEGDPCGSGGGDH